jgi:hypothetical protein
MKNIGQTNVEIQSLIINIEPCGDIVKVLQKKISKEDMKPLGIMLPKVFISLEVLMAKVFLAMICG